MAVLFGSLFMLFAFEAAFGRLLNNKEQTEMLKYHNAKRSELKGRRIPLLTYDTKLAGLAKSWADKCQFKHPGRGDYKYKLTGQNIAACGRCTEQEALKKAYEGWYNEINDYRIGTHKCKPRKVCGHYTQMVWKKTTKLGCAIAKCDNIFKMQGNFVVCQYAPQGNIIGEKPF